MSLKNVKRLALFAMGAVVLLLLGRAGYFLLFPANSSIYFAGTEAPCVAPAGRLKEYHFKPNCSGIGRAGARNAPMSFNSEGLRDRDYGPSPSKGVYRVLIFGASNVLGIGLPEESTLPRLLESDLRKLLKKKVEVINAATNGYCTWQTAFKARALIRRYRPNLVLHNVGVPNCFLYDWIWDGRIVFKEGGEPVGIDRALYPADSLLSVLNSWYFHPSVFFKLHTAHEMTRRVVAAWKLKLKSPEDRISILTESTKRALEYLNRASREEGAFYIAFFHPARQPIVNQFLPYVMSAGLARMISSFEPEVSVPHSRLWSHFMQGNVPIMNLKTFIFEHEIDDGHLTMSSTRDWSKQLAAALKASFAFRFEPPGQAKFVPASPL